MAYKLYHDNAFMLTNLAELHTRFLQPLDKLFNLSDASASSKLIGFYSGLLRHWISDHFMPPHESALPPDADGIIIHYMRHVSSIVVHSLQVSSFLMTVCI